MCCLSISLTVSLQTYMQILYISYILAKYPNHFNQSLTLWLRFFVTLIWNNLLENISWKIKLKYCAHTSRHTEAMQHAATYIPNNFSKAIAQLLNKTIWSETILLVGTDVYEIQPQHNTTSNSMLWKLHPSKIPGLQITCRGFPPPAKLVKYEKSPY